jgi:hypothetical protein
VGQVHAISVIRSWTSTIHHRLKYGGRAQPKITDQLDQ